MSQWSDSRSGTGPKPDWRRLRKEAVAALRRRFASRGWLTPAAAAATVMAVLPKPLRRRFLRCFGKLGWLEPRAVVPFDVLERPDCPPLLRGPGRELARLALFGLPGQGVPYREKRRQDLYQQFCSEIMRTAVDTESLRGIAERALNHPEVQADTLLSGMLRSFIAQREAALRAERTTPDEQYLRTLHRSKLRRAFEPAGRCDVPTREELLASFGRLLADFDRYLAQFEETRAGAVLEKMQELRRRYPVHIAALDLQRCEEQLDRLRKRAGTYRRQINQLAEQAADAAQRGDEKTAAWVVRRLEAINSLLPSLLPRDELERLREEITRRGRQRETEEAAQEFTARQQEVMARIKNLAGVVHRFYQLAQRLPPEHEAYKRAEQNYRRAVAEIRRLDTEWLTGLVLQLEALLEDLEDPDGRMQSQLDEFIAAVRTALNNLCLEIRAWQSRGAPPPPPAPPASPPPPPA